MANPYSRLQDKVVHFEFKLRQARADVDDYKSMQRLVADLRDQLRTEYKRGFDDGHRVGFDAASNQRMRRETKTRGKARGKVAG